MRTHSKAAVMIVVFGFVAILAYKFLLPLIVELFEESQQKETSDAKAIKGKILVGVDNWIGYFPLCSQEMRKRMRRSGYNLQCEDDNADYKARMQRLEDGELHFAVATIDSYILNGSKLNYPGTIISVIDESKGGDAIVAWKDKLNNLDALKARDSYKIAFTPNSPSEHLLKSLAVHFDVPSLMGANTDWRVETNGSQDALKILMDKQADAAVLWEPDVSRALQNKNIVKLLGTEDTNKLIVDILLVNRKFSQREPEAVSVLLNQYFRTLKYYRDNPQKFLQDAAEYTNVESPVIKTMLAGVDWISLSQNSLFWYGTASLGSAPTEGLVDAIESTARILMDHGDYTNNPIPDGDPYRLINSQFVSELFSAGVGTTQFGQSGIGQNNDRDADPKAESSLEKPFDKLTDAQWEALREIGTLKIRPIVFQSGVDELTYDGKAELDKAAENLEHYPNFRIVIKGHTGTRGDAKANEILSQDRAESVARYFNVTYGIDVDRLRPIGLGSSQPLPQKPGESSRAYNYRLPRVEIFLVTEDL
jgi:outer membrane protein OmpA-like peptidoglycan-associated protein/ABC-type nitrate/sulfonate/bicarbonate transport system substrate-binding protein